MESSCQFRDNETAKKVALLYQWPDILSKNAQYEDVPLFALEKEHSKSINDNPIRSQLEKNNIILLDWADKRELELMIS